MFTEAGRKGAFTCIRVLTVLRSVWAKLVHSLGVSEEPQFKLCFILCQLAPSSAFICVQSTPDNTRAVGPSLFSVEFSGCHLCLMPEIASISCDLGQHKQDHLGFYLDVGRITPNETWLWEQPSLWPWEPQMYFCILPGRKSLLVCFIPVLESEAMGLYCFLLFVNHILND